MKGIVYVAFGPKAQDEVVQSTDSLRKHSRLPTKVLTKLQSPAPQGLTTKQQAHWAKVSVDQWSPYDPTLLLDADTRIHGDISLGFKILQVGWEVVMIPSTPPHEGSVLWHLDGTERQQTFQELGTWRHPMLNSGVMFFRKTPSVKALFKCWRQEWLRFKGPDQGALLRALRRRPVFMWLLGHPFNSRHGEVIEHLFGRAQ